MRDPERKATEVHPYHVVNDNVQIQVDTIPHMDLIKTHVDTDPQVDTIPTQEDTEVPQAKEDGAPLDLESGCTTSKKLNCIIALLTTLIVLCTGAAVVSFTQAEAEPILVFLS